MSIREEARRALSVASEAIDRHQRQNAWDPLMVDHAKDGGEFYALTAALARAVEGLLAEQDTRESQITDEMVTRADLAIQGFWRERYPVGSLTTEIARAALEAALGKAHETEQADREPSTDEAVVVARVIRDHDEESLTCYDHDGTCCPCGKHDMSHAEWELHRARAALLAAQEVRNRG